MERSPAPGGGDVSLELVERIRSGDRRAWDELYARYHDPLLFAIRCRLGPGLRSRLQSEDVLQSVVLDALRDLVRYEHRGPGSLGHYLHACVLNKIRRKAEYHGARKRNGEVPLTDALEARLPGPATEEPLRYFECERYEALESGIARLPEEMREVVILRAVEGQSNREAASLLHRSEESTSKLYNRALARLGSLVGLPAPRGGG